MKSGKIGPILFVHNSRNYLLEKTTCGNLNFRDGSDERKIVKFEGSLAEFQLDETP